MPGYGNGRISRWLRFCVPMGAAWAGCVVGLVFYVFRDGLMSPACWYDTPVILALLFGVPVVTAFWAWRRNWGMKQRLRRSAVTFVLAVLTELAAAVLAWILVTFLMGILVMLMAG